MYEDRRENALFKKGIFKNNAIVSDDLLSEIDLSLLEKKKPEDSFMHVENETTEVDESVAQEVQESLIENSETELLKEVDEDDLEENTELEERAVKNKKKSSRKRK